MLTTYPADDRSPSLVTDKPQPKVMQFAETIGRALAMAGYTLITGGMSGVMEAASRGARRAGGYTFAHRLKTFFQQRQQSQIIATCLCFSMIISNLTCIPFLPAHG